LTNPENSHLIVLFAIPDKELKKRRVKCNPVSKKVASLDQHHQTNGNFLKHRAIGVHA